MSDIFKIGTQFDTFDEFYEEFSKWCYENYHPVNIHDSHLIKEEGLIDTIKYKDIHIACLHSGKPKIRANQGKRQCKSMRHGCPFGIKLSYSSDSNKLVIRKFNPEHDHIVNSELFLKYPKNRQPNDEEIECINDLIKLGCSPKKIVRQFNELTQKTFTTKDLYNKKEKFDELNVNELVETHDQNFANIMCKIQADKSNYVKLRIDDDGIMTCVFFSLNCQLPWFNKFANNDNFW